MTHFFERNFKTIICVLVTAAICICAGAFIGRTVTVSQMSTPNLVQVDTTAKPKDDKNAVLQKTTEILGLIDKYYVGETDTEKLGNGLASGLIAGMGDRWSYYISADDYAEYMEGMNNAYVGVGITIRLEHEDDIGFTVLSVTKNSPAEEAGVRAGDLFVKVNGEDVLALGMDATKNTVRGEEGTDVTLTFVRDGKELELTMTRASVAVENVTCQLLEDDIGYIKISNFDTNACKDTISAIEELQAQGAKSLLFDVRYNPGGMKTELVSLLDYLLPEGKLFISEDFNGEQSVDYSDAACLAMPMAVLINEDSYSAAEFFAAALKEYGVATVLGTQTCGKGYFQTTFQLSDGSAVAISIGKYKTPNGVSLADAGGLVPDQIVAVDEETYYNTYYGLVSIEDDTQIQAAVDGLHGGFNP